MLNISRQIYAALGTTTSDGLPTGTVVPVGNTSGEKNKINKLKKSSSSMTLYENIPLPGFTLHSATRVRYSSDQTWQVIDPRGFMVNITSDNLQDILTITGITEGLIQQKCVWVRDNARTTMKLMPVTSKIYNEALVGTELIESKVSMSEVQIGDEVLLQSQLRGKYMGVVSLYRSLQTHYRDNGKYKADSSLRRQVIEVLPGKYHFMTDLKILQVVNKTTETLTQQDYIDKMNSEIKQGTAFFTSETRNVAFVNSKYYTGQAVKFVSKSAKSDVTLSLQEITKADAALIIPSILSTKDAGELMLEDSNKKKFILEFPWRSSNTIDSFSVLEIIGMDDKTISVSADKLKFLLHNASNPKLYSLNSFVKFYKIVKHVKDDTYI